MKKRLFTALTIVPLLLLGLCLPANVHAADPFCHIVKPGENITQIAQHYGVTVAQIAEANNLWNPNLIYPGQCLLIPLSSSSCDFYHTVRRGEYLKIIAARYGVSVTAIVQANGLRNPNLIYAGQRLKIPCTSAPPPQPEPPPTQPCVKTHLVKRGEYLKIIAAKYGVSVTAIVKANGLVNPNVIYPGQRLKIPCETPAPPTPQPGAWRGQYWNNRDQSGAAKYTQNVKTIDFTWGQNRPDPRLGKDNFSMRWKRTREFDAGSYRFHIKADDGARLWLDGELLIDEWHDTPPQEYTADKQLDAGSHSLQIDYYEHAGSAQIKFWIESLDPPIPSNAWLAEYFSNRFFEPPATITRLENKIDYDWGTEPPSPGFRPDDFAIRWTRDVWFQGGDYHFTVEVDDGVELLIDGAPIIAEWHDTNGATYGQDVHLTRGTHRVRVNYYEGTGAASIRLNWTRLPISSPWKGEYYNNMKAQGSPVVTRNDQAIDFNWGKKSPATGVSADYFSARWTNDAYFTGGVYRFSATTDDGIRIYLDDWLILDEWHDTSPKTFWVEIPVSAGSHRLKVEYYEREGTAVAKVWWALR